MVGPPSFPGPITVQASISNSTQDPPYAQTTCGPFNGESGNKKTCTLSFRASGASTSLILQGTQGAEYIGLDNVSVQCVAPLGRKGFCS